MVIMLVVGLLVLVLVRVRGVVGVVVLLRVERLLVLSSGPLAVVPLVLFLLNLVILKLSEVCA